MSKEKLYESKDLFRFKEVIQKRLEEAMECCKHLEAREPHGVLQCDVCKQAIKEGFVMINHWANMDSYYNDILPKRMIVCCGDCFAKKVKE
jgi:hypothetical protein